MKATVINLDSTFDWKADVAGMLELLDGRRIADALKLPEEMDAIAACLDELRWVFLVSDLTLNAQVESNPYGEGPERDENEKDAEPPWKQRVERRRKCNRRGDNDRNPLYRQPRLTRGGGVIEALGIYAPDLRTFCAQAPLTPPNLSSRSVSPEEHLKKAGALDSLLPPGADGPAVILCPERLFALPSDLVRSLDPWEPHPSARLNVSELFLRMTLFHEIGHHMLPAPTSEDNNNRQVHRVMLSEALANTFCDALLASEERPWLFAKARLLQPSAYLAYFVPHILANLESTSRFAEAWTHVIRQSLHREPLHARRFFREFEMEMGMCGHIPPFVASEEMYLALYGLFGALGDFPPGCFRHALHSHKPCAIGVFEEFEMPWATEAGLRDLLSHFEPSVEAEAFHMLDRKKPRDTTFDPVLANWCDANLTSDHHQAAQRAWESSFADREEGRLDRYRAVAASAHEAIVAELPARVRSHCSPKDARPIIEPLLKDPRIFVRLEALREMAAILYESKDVETLENLLLAKQTEGLEGDWKDWKNHPTVKAAKLELSLILFLAVWEHPQRATTKWTSGFLYKLASKLSSLSTEDINKKTREVQVALEAHDHLVEGPVAWSDGGVAAPSVIFRNFRGRTAPARLTLAIRVFEALRDSKSGVNPEKFNEHISVLLKDVFESYGFDEASKFTDRVFEALEPGVRMSVVNDLLFGGWKQHYWGPVTDGNLLSPKLRLMVVRSIGKLQLYSDSLTAKLITSTDPGSDCDCLILAQVFDDGRRLGANWVCAVATAIATWRTRWRSGPTELRNRAAAWLLDWLKEKQLSEQIQWFRDVLNAEGVEVVLEVVLPPLLQHWPMEQASDFLEWMACHENGLVRYHAVQHLQAQELLGGEMQRNLLLDPEFEVMERVWQYSARRDGEGKLLEITLPHDLIIQVATGATPSQHKMEFNLRNRAQSVLKEAMQYLLNMLPFMTQEEQESTKQALRGSRK